MTTPNINTLLRAKPVNSRFGAPLGRRSIQASELPVYLQQVQFVDGDYAPDGTYWGGGYGTAPIWCAFTPDLTVEIYVRAYNRATAAAEVLERFPTVNLRKGVRT